MMQQISRPLTLALACLALFPALALAQPAIPEALEPWRDWVLFGQEFRACPVLNGRDANQTASHVCAWPGELAINVDPAGATFTQDWTLYQEEWVPLPGDNRYWPSAVTVDGRPTAAVFRGGRPTVRVPAGPHRIAGSLAWETRPASLPIPEQTGLVRLELDGSVVPLPEVERGVLWLGLRPELAVEEDRLNVEVYRRLIDSIPIRLETRIQIDVAGQSREVSLAGALIPGFVGESLTTALPAELDADGTLRVQVRPGRWVLRLMAHQPAIVESIVRPDSPAPWPTDEIWSLQSDPALRVAVLEGVPALDAQRAGVPPEWQALPAFSVAADSTLNLVERSRNDAIDSNALTLDRYLWLDFDGSGFTAEDRVSGALRRDWRLDMLPPYTMTMASIGSENLLITEGESPELQGVELRTTTLDLTATARVPAQTSLPVTGYSDRFDLSRTVLFLPPAHRLLAAPGADIAGGAWIERWRLLDIFLALIIAVASFRLLGPVGGVVALATLILTYHEPGAPHYAWLNLLLITALVRVAPAGWMRTWCQRYRYASVAAIALLLIPFAALELRAVIFPQLERGFLERNLDPVSGFDDSRSPFYLGASIANLRGLNTAFGTRTLTLVDSRQMPAPTNGGVDMNFIPSALVDRIDTVTGGASATYGADAVFAGQEGQAEAMVVTGNRVQRDDFTAAQTTSAVSAAEMQALGLTSVTDMVNQLPVAAPGSSSRYQPGALVQTGPGLPDWGWNRYSLGFNGPIEADQTYSLVILGPVLVGLWRTAGVMLSLLLVGLLLRPELNALRGSRGPGNSKGAAVTAGLLVLVLALAPPRPAEAQSVTDFPSPELLNELRQRLTEPAPCHPTCAELSDARVGVTDETLVVELQIAAQAAVAVPIPTNAEGWRPDEITVDAGDRRLLYRDATGQAWIRLDEGVRSISLSGPLPPTDSLSLAFPLPPRRIAVAATGWDVAGVSEGRLPSGALELIRQREAAADDELIQSTAFPPYVRLTRNIRFGIDWTVTTLVERIAPRNDAFTIGIDLLPEETVVSEAIDVEDGIATIAFTAGQTTANWESRLPASATLDLVAAAAAPWSESWRLDVGHEWHVEYDGLPMTNVFPRGGLSLITEFLPRPGETLSLTLSRPEPVSGDTIAIDNVNYVHTVGERSSTSQIDFSYRSTRATEHPLRLPPGSELESVSIDGRVIPLRLDGDTLSLPVVPGEQNVSLSWRNPVGIGLRAEVGPVDLGAGASNLTTRLNLPADRWTLFTFGPTLGPAVLYWAELLVFAVAAVILGRIRISPLRSQEWLLLGLGLSTFSWPVLLLFAVWAFVLSWRGRTQIDARPLVFNGLQVVLGLLTIAVLISLLSSIANGLLGSPDMHVVSPVAGGGLGWFQDRSPGTTPSSGAISVSLWFYKAAMLAWALWLSFALLRWLRWAWTALTVEGFWRGRLQTRSAG